MATVAVAAFARQIDVATMPESPFADAEISTNVVLHLARRDTRKLDVHIQLDGTETNNLDVAFGRDVNTNRILEAEEIDAVYGWRRGRYFIENLRDWASLETVADTNAPCCAFDIHMEMTPEIVLKRFAATCGGELSFPEIATNAPPAWPTPSSGTPWATAYAISTNRFCAFPPMPKPCWIFPMTNCRL